MMSKPYIVWHSMSVVSEEHDLASSDSSHLFNDLNLTRRYVVWATSAQSAARFVDEFKREQGRLLPDVYMVCSLSPEQDGVVHELLEDDQTDLDSDLDTFEGLFGQPTTVRLR